MNRLLVRLIAIMAFLTPVSVFAAGPIGNNTTPIQTYQDANSPQPTPKWIDPTQSSSSPKAQPASSLAKPISQPSVASDNPAAVPIGHQSGQMLQAELMQLNQNNLMFEQKTDEQLIELENKNQILQQQLTQMTQAMALLNQEITQLKAANTNLTQQAKQAEPVRQTAAFTLVELARVIEHHLGETALKAIISGVLILIAIFLWAIWPRKPKAKTQSAQAGDDTKDEYDYMGSPESIPAKIDLARTYIAMEDYTQARNVLREVSSRGNDEYKQQAQGLLDELPAES